MPLRTAAERVCRAAQRPDVGRVFPDCGSGFGFEGAIAAGPGSHRVCVTAVNIGLGGNTPLGCRTITVPTA